MNIRTRLWTILTNAYPAYLRWRYGMDIGKNCRISWKARFDKISILKVFILAIILGY